MRQVDHQGSTSAPSDQAWGLTWPYARGRGCQGKKWGTTRTTGPTKKNTGKQRKGAGVLGERSISSYIRRIRHPLEGVSSECNSVFKCQKRSWLIESERKSSLPPSSSPQGIISNQGEQGSKEGRGTDPDRAGEEPPPPSKYKQ